MLGDAVAVYLDAGPVGERYADADPRAGRRSSTPPGSSRPSGKLRIVRHGVIPDDEIVAIVGADRCA